MHVGTGGAPITGTSFGQITREHNRKAIRILGGDLVRNRCRPLGHAHRTMGVQDPLCNAAPTEYQGQETTYPKGSLSGCLWASPCKSCGTRERSSQLHSPQAFTAACSLPTRQQGSGGRSEIYPPSMSSCIARASLWRHLGQSSGPYNRASG